MKPREPRESGQCDMFRSRLDQILDMGHAKVILAGKIDWRFLSEKMGDVYTDGPGQPPLSNRLMAGLHILKYADDLSDDEVCARWLENPYYQYFCGEEFFHHRLPLDRSSMTRWRQRMGEERLSALLQESLSVAVKTGAAKPADFTRAVIDTTVAEKDVAFPTDAKLMHRARQRLVKQARRAGIGLRQSYVRVGKRALIAHQRYAHAKQFKRARRQLRKLRTYLGRTIRDIERKIEGDVALEDAFLRPLWLSQRVMTQKKRDPSPKVYALHAPEVECIGKGKPHKPYEFGVKVSVATTLKRCKGGQFAIHAKAPCRGGPTTATPSKPSSQRSKSSPAPPSQAHPRRRRLQGPQRTRRLQAARLHRRAEAPRHPGHQTPDETPLGRRAGHRPPQGRPPHGPQPPRPQARRRDQPDPRSRRLQLPPHPQMDQTSFVSDLDMDVRE